MARSIVARAGCVLLALAATDCGTVGNVFGPSQSPQEGQPGFIKGFIGAVVADEPRAAAAGREVLSRGGTAGDAAVTVGFMLATTLPSRAGIGGGGACLAFATGRKSINEGVPEAVSFVPPAPESGSVGSDRPAAVPMLPRGLYLLHARYGHLPLEGLIAPAEQAARFGVPAPRALIRDLSVVAEPLVADPAARGVFARGGSVLAEGQTLQQPELAATLAQIRVAGVGDMYQGGLARRIEDASRPAGGVLTVSDLRAALPRMAEPLMVRDGRDSVAFLPPPADGGLAAAAAFQALQRNSADFQSAAAHGLAAAARWRQGGATAESIMATPNLPPAALPPLPASTTFATLDHNGNAVVCALTMNNLFGTGRILPGIGFLLAASPAAVPPPLLSAALAWNENIKEFRAETGGSGQAGAPLAAALAMIEALRNNQPLAPLPPDPGRANAISCGRYLPGEEGACVWANDPRDFGLATGGT